MERACPVCQLSCPGHSAGQGGWTWRGRGVGGEPTGRYGPRRGWEAAPRGWQPTPPRRRGRRWSGNASAAVAALAHGAAPRGAARRPLTTGATPQAGAVDAWRRPVRVATANGWEDGMWQERGDGVAPTGSHRTQRD